MYWQVIMVHDPVTGFPGTGLQLALNA